jgi:YD repeat-containing protein
MPTRTPLPTLRADHRGYILDGVATEDFSDRAELTRAQRKVIARLARRYAPETLSEEQRDLAEDTGDVRVPSEELRAATLDEAELEEIFGLGFLDELTDEDVRLVSTPSLHPDLAGASYPLSVGQLATLTTASERQLRYWDKVGLITAHRMNGGRRFFHAAAARAMVLSQSQNQEVAALAAIARRGADGERLIRLAGGLLAETFRDASGEARRQLAHAGEALVRQSKALVTSEAEPIAPRQDSGAAARDLSENQNGGPKVRAVKSRKSAKRSGRTASRRLPAARTSAKAASRKTGTTSAKGARKAGTTSAKSRSIKKSTSRASKGTQ